MCLVSELIGSLDAEAYIRIRSSSTCLRLPARHFSPASTDMCTRSFRTRLETTSLLLCTSVNMHAQTKLRHEACLVTRGVDVRHPLQEWSNSIPLLLLARSLLLPAQIHCVLTPSTSHHLCTSQTVSLSPAQPAQGNCCVLVTVPAHRTMNSSHIFSILSESPHPLTQPTHKLITGAVQRDRPIAITLIHVVTYLSLSRPV